MNEPQQLSHLFAYQLASQSVGLEPGGPVSLGLALCVYASIRGTNVRQPIMTWPPREPGPITSSHKDTTLPRNVLTTLGSRGHEANTNRLKLEVIVYFW